MAVKKNVRPPASQGGGSRKKPWSWQALTLISAVLVAVLAGVFPEWFPDLGGEEHGVGDGGGRGARARKSKASGERKSKLSFNLNKTIERSAKAIKDQDWARAEKLAVRATKEAPESWKAWLQLGMAKRLGGGAAGVLPAVEAFTKAVEVNRDGGAVGLAESHSYLASALSCTPMLATAKKHAFKALSMQPDLFEALATAVKLTNFSEAALDPGATPLLDKMWGLMRSHEKALREETSPSSSKSKAAKAKAEAEAAEAKTLAAKASEPTKLSELVESVNEGMKEAAAAVKEGDSSAGGEVEAAAAAAVAGDEEEEDDGIVGARLKFHDLARLHFYLFKALDERGEHGKAATHLLEGNELRHTIQLFHDATSSGGQLPQWGKEATANLLNELVVAFHPRTKAQELEEAASKAASATASGDEGEEEEVVGPAISQDWSKLLPAAAALSGKGEESDFSTSSSEVVSRKEAAAVAEAKSDFGEGYCRSLLQKVGVKPKQRSKQQKTKSSGQQNGNKDENGDDDDDDADAADDEEDEEEEDEEEDDDETVATPFVRPLMVVGMPRAGETLLQQMLASHPNILLGDEYPAFMSALKIAIHTRMTSTAAAGRPFGATDQIGVLARDPEAIAEIHQRYLEELHVEAKAAALAAAASPDLLPSTDDPSTPSGGTPLAAAAAANSGRGWLSSLLFGRSSGADKGSDNNGDSDNGVSKEPLLYVVDKAPSNSWWVGAAPPCAKVVVVKREAMEVGYSNFKTGFSQAGYEFTYNQTELGWRVAMTDRVLQTWEAFMPRENLHVVTYDELVLDPESAAKALHAFLGLPYHPASSRPHEAGHPITSASGSSELRRPVEEQSAWSRGRWEKYASDLEELMVGHSEAKKWVKYVTDNGGAGPDQGWLARGAGLEQQKASEKNLLSEASRQQQQKNAKAGAASSSSSSSLGLGAAGSLGASLGSSLGGDMDGGGGHAATTAVKLLQQVEAERKRAAQAEAEAQEAEEYAADLKADALAAAAEEEEADASA